MAGAPCLILSLPLHTDLHTEEDTMSDMIDEKARASAWFRELRNQIVASFERLEDAFGGDEPACHGVSNGGLGTRDE